MNLPRFYAGSMPSNETGVMLSWGMASMIIGPLSASGVG